MYVWRMGQSTREYICSEQGVDMGFSLVESVLAVKVKLLLDAPMDSQLLVPPISCFFWAVKGSNWLTHSHKLPEKDWMQEVRGLGGQ